MSISEIIDVFSSSFLSVCVRSLLCVYQSIRRKDDPQEVRVQIQFLTYGTRASKDKSGAYLFLPDGIAMVMSLTWDWFIREIRRME